MNNQSIATDIIDELDWFVERRRDCRQQDLQYGWAGTPHAKINDFYSPSPFTAYTVVVSAAASAPEVYLVFRGVSPVIKAKNPRAMYASYLSENGRLLESKPGRNVVGLGEIQATAVFTFKAMESVGRKPPFGEPQYDATNCRIASLDAPEDHIRSLREFLRAAGDKREGLVSNVRFRPYLQRMSLPDQAILDEAQGAAFRARVDSTVLLIGAAGTGKTTTLIKRIARNQDFANLSSDEKTKFKDRQELFQSGNWKLFIPSDLLKQYVQEAFSKENIAASSDRIKVWDDERLELARDVLRFAKIGDEGYFFQKPSASVLNDGDCLAQYRQFKEFHAQWVLSQIAEFAAKRKNAFKDVDSDAIDEIEQALAQKDIWACCSAIRRCRERISGNLRDKVYDAASNQPERATSRQEADAKGEGFAPTSLREMATQAARGLARLSQLYGDSIPRAYAEFAIGGNGTAKTPEGIGIEEYEYDVLIRVMLETARGFMRLDPSPAWGVFGRIKASFVTQIVIDEASDFTVNQLAAMGALAHPWTDSVTICGDAMQRLNASGIADWGSLSSAFTQVDRHELKLGYRHSPALVVIANDLRKLTDKAAPMLKSAYEGMEAPPAVKKLATDLENQVGWVAGQILAVYRSLENRLPTMAVFVSDESEVESTAHALSAALHKQNIRVQACRAGENLGVEQRVRVFDVKNIKGLEFEAVFFLGFDRLEKKYGDLSRNYLYVGLTRAAMYMGVTYSQLPAALADVAHRFAEVDLPDVPKGRLREEESVRSGGDGYSQGGGDLQDFAREDGRFGSFPSYDAMDDESFP